MPPEPVNYEDVSDWVCDRIEELSGEDLREIADEMLGEAPGLLDHFLIRAWAVVADALNHCDSLDDISSSLIEIYALANKAWQSPRQKPTIENIEKKLLPIVESLVGGVVAKAMIDCDRATSDRVRMRRLDRVYNAFMPYTNGSKFHPGLMADSIFKWEQFVYQQQKKLHWP